MKYDFHCHSCYSDGSLTPQELAEYAAEREIGLLALTDHDSVSGLKDLRQYIIQKQLPLNIVDGIEISALADFGEVHIVGLGINPDNQNLKFKLEAQLLQRWQRAEDIDHRLVKAGVVGVLDKLKIDVVEIVTRSHMAKAIVELGFAKDAQQAFKKYIGKQGRIKVAKNWMSMDEAISLIKEAGGISVLAHPTRYPLSNRKLGYLIEAFKEEGGDAIELAYPSLNRDKYEWLKIHLERHQLMASSGSDFHYPNLRWTDLGRFPGVDSDIPHVLEKLI